MLINKNYLITFNENSFVLVDTYVKPTILNGGYI